MSKKETIIWYEGTKGFAMREETNKKDVEYYIRKISFRSAIKKARKEAKDTDDLLRLIDQEYHKLWYQFTKMKVNYEKERTD